MIIDFTITNFRSFKSDEMLSMIVDTNFSRHVENYNIIEEKIAVLRSAVIVGANASGKSNFFHAVKALKWIVENSGSLSESRSLIYEPYKLCNETLNSPTQFDIEFVIPSGVRYQYSVSFNKKRILNETLYYFPKRQKALLFERTVEDTWETIKFGSTYKGGTRKLSFFPNNSYLSKAGNDASTPENIRDVFKYFQSIIVIDARYTNKPTKYYGSKSWEAISQMLQMFDTGINQVTAEENNFFKDINFPEGTPEGLKQIVVNENKFTYSFWMQGEDGKNVSFDEDEISDGTKKIFNLIPIILSALGQGIPIFVDELDGHLHTNILLILLSLFNDSELNINGSQLIFTTHDTNVLDSNKLRRDQIWFLQREKNGSKLKALDSYDKSYVRQDSPFESFYNSGRFGALPKINVAQVRKYIKNFFEN